MLPKALQRKPTCKRGPLSSLERTWLGQQAQCHCCSSHAECCCCCCRQWETWHVGHQNSLLPPLRHQSPLADPFSLPSPLRHPSQPQDQAAGLPGASPHSPPWLQPWLQQQQRAAPCSLPGKGSPKQIRTWALLRQLEHQSTPCWTQQQLYISACRLLLALRLVLWAGKRRPPAVPPLTAGTAATAVEVAPVPPQLNLLMPPLLVSMSFQTSLHLHKLMPKVVLLDDFLVCLCKTEIPAAVQPSSVELSIAICKY